MNLDDIDIPLINEVNNKPEKKKKSNKKDSKVKETQVNSSEILELNSGKSKDHELSFDKNDISRDIERLMKDKSRRSSSVENNSSIDISSSVFEDSASKTNTSIDALASQFDNLLDFKASNKEASVDEINNMLEDILEKTTTNNVIKNKVSEEGIIEEIIEPRKNTSKKRKKKTKKLAYNITMTILVCIFVGCAAYLINYYVKTKKSESKFDALRDLIIADEDIPDEEDTEYIPVVDDEGNVETSKSSRKANLRRS